MSSNGNEYDALSVAYRDRYGRGCAFVTWTAGQVVAHVLVLAAGWVAFVMWPYETWVAFSYALAVFIFVALTLRLIAIGLSAVSDPTINITADESVAVEDKDLPVYSVLVPLYREPEVVPELLKALEALDYPKGKLDVQLLLEPDDQPTRAALESASLPGWIRVTLSPGGQPRTKPRACNVGLTRCRGEYIVIFDAEDRPEPDQLRKAVAAYSRLPASVVCLQARLAHYNSRQGIFAQWSAMEYLLWFRLVLPGMQCLGAPIPLGGTSNHFRASALREMGGWDPFNVTEDCDLGMRIARRGWQTRMIASTTWEEAVTSLGGWVRQRSRWVKGYWQTWLVHSRAGSLSDLGLWRWTLMMFMVGGSTVMLLVNPLLWGVIVAWLVVGWPLVDVANPVSIGALALTLVMLAANGVFVIIAMVGCVIGRRGDLVPAALASPFEWVLFSVAAWKGWLQFFGRPFFWEKTHHGVFEADAHRGHISARAAVAASFLVLILGSVGVAAFVQVRVARDIARQGVVKAVQLPSLFDDAEWATTTVVNDFEKGVAGWLTAPAGRLESDPAPVGISNRALRATLKLPGWRDIWCEPRTNWAGCKAVAVDCLVPAGAPEGLRVILMCHDRGRYWYQHESPQKLVPGQWTRIEADLRPSSRQWRPTGHRKSWDDYSAQYVRMFGVKIHGVASYSGPVWIDTVQTIPLVDSERPDLEVPSIALRGTLPQTVKQYNCFEAAFDLGKPFANPFDPDVVDVQGVFTGPDGKKATIPGFFYQEFERTLADAGERVTAVGRGYWRVRFAPTQPGSHSFVVRVKEANRDVVESATHAFVVEASEMPGFVRRSGKKPQFLARDDGSSFYMVGHNICWPVDVNQPCEYGEFKGQKDQGTFTYDRWLDKMAENGENWGRIWLSPWNMGFEAPAEWTGFDGMGRYNLGNAWRLDRVLNRATERGMTLTFTIQHMSEFKGSFVHHAYLNKNRGTLAVPVDFFRDPFAVRAMQNRLRYIVARWGYSPNVLAWELWGEVNLVPGVRNNDKLVVDWHRDMALYLRGIDPWKHMVFTHCHNWQEWDDLWALPWIDCVQGNGYIRPPNKTTDHVDNFRRYISEVEDFAKPIFVAEYGGRSELGAPSTDYLEAQLHSGLWASIMHPFAGTAEAWWWNFLDARDLYWHYKGVSAFVKDVDRVKNDFVTVSPPVTPESCGLRATGMRADDMVVAWVYHGNIFTNWAEIPEVKDVSVTLEGLKGGTWRVEYWDTCAAEVIRGETVKTDPRGMVRLVLPPVRRDIALKLRRSEADTD